MVQEGDKNLLEFPGQKRGVLVSADSVVNKDGELSFVVSADFKAKIEEIVGRCLLEEGEVLKLEKTDVLDGLDCWIADLGNGESIQLFAVPGESDENVENIGGGINYRVFLTINLGICTVSEEEV